MFNLGLSKYFVYLLYKLIMCDKIKEKINNDVKDKILYCQSGYVYKMDLNIG